MNISVFHVQDVNMTCVVNDTRTSTDNQTEQIQYVWTRNGETIPNQDKNVYNIREFNETDTGSYACIATLDNPLDQQTCPFTKASTVDNVKSSQVNYEVHSNVVELNPDDTPPELVIVIPTGVIYEGMHVDLKCQSPNPTDKQYIWWKNGQITPNPPGLFWASNILHIMPISQSHAGVYRCEASSSDGYLNMFSQERTLVVIPDNDVSDESGEIGDEIGGTDYNYNLPLVPNEGTEIEIPNDRRAITSEYDNEAGTQSPYPQQSIGTTRQNIETTPETIETTRKNIEDTPKYIETTRETIETTPQTTETTPENIDTTPQNIDTTPEDIKTAPEKIPNSPQNPVCQCSCEVKRTTTLTQEELKQKTSAIQRYLSVNTTTLLSTRLRKQCQTDHRSSSTYIGLAAKTALCLVFGTIVGQDFVVLISCIVTLVRGRRGTTY